MPVIEL